MHAFTIDLLYNSSESIEYYTSFSTIYNEDEPGEEESGSEEDSSQLSDSVK